MACTVVLYVTLLLILFVEDFFNSVLEHILKVFVLLFLSHPSTRYWLHIYSHCHWNITVLRYNIITFRYREWDQNTFTTVAAVNYDSLKNNGNTLVNKYKRNCGSCMFIAIQYIPHLNRVKVWNEVFSTFCSFVDQFVIFVWKFPLFTGWSLRRLEGTQTYVWMQLNQNFNFRLGAIFVSMTSVHSFGKKHGNAKQNTKSKIIFPEIGPNVSQTIFGRLNKFSYILY